MMFVRIFIFIAIALVLSVAQAQAPVLSDENPIITPDNAGQVTQLAMIGRGIPQDIMYSPDGTRLAIGTSMGVWLYDAHSPLATPRLLTDTYQQGWIWDIDFSPDSRFIAAGTGGDFYEWGDNILIVWDVQTGAVLHHIPAHQRGIVEVVYSPDGLTITTTSRDGQSHIWDAQTGALLTTMPASDTETSDANILAYSPDGQFSASITDSLTVLNIKTGELQSYADSSFNGQLSRATFSPDLQTIYYAEDDLVGAVEVDSLTSRQPISNGKTLTTLAFTQIYPLIFFVTPDNHQMIIITQPYGVNTENGTFVFNLQTGEVSHYIQTSPRILNAHYDAERHWLITATFTQLDIHDTQTGALLHQLSSDVVIDDFVYDNVNHRLIISQSNAKLGNLFDVRIQTYDLSHPTDDWTVISSIELNNTLDSVELGITPDGRIIRSSYNRDSGIFTIEDIDNQTKIQLQTDANQIQNPQFSPDGQLVLVELSETILLWDVQTGQLLTTLRGHTDWVRAEWRADGRAIISTGNDGTIRIWGVPVQS